MTTPPSPTSLSDFPITKKWPAQHPDRLQLYSLATPNGVKISIALEETGLPYEAHYVSFERNEQMSPDFLSLSPNNKIPAVIDIDELLNKHFAILGTTGVGKSTGVAVILQQILAARPDYGWLSEEGGEKERPDARRSFMVDPIDGTTAFLKAKPHFSISVAVIEEARPVAGVVYNPVTEECFAAARETGSRLNGNPIRVGSSDCIEGCRILGPKDMFAHPAWSTPPNTPWPDMRIEQRSSIAYRMALVAAGTFDAALVLSAKHDWDMAAGDLIVREAGGEVTTHTGTALHFGGPVPLQRSMVCAGPALHALLLERLKHITLPQR